MSIIEMNSEMPKGCKALADSHRIATRSLSSWFDVDISSLGSLATDAIPCTAKS
jgi:hypothetical protein